MIIIIIIIISYIYKQCHVGQQPLPFYVPVDTAQPPTRKLDPLLYSLSLSTV